METFEDVVLDPFLEVFKDKKTKLWGIRDIDDHHAILNIRGSDALFTKKEVAEEICRLLNKHAFF